MRKSGRWKMQKKINRSICSVDLAIFKTYPHLRKPMSGAFDFAWSVLKALPEQQPFSQHVRPQKQFERGGQTVDVRRFPTVHPAIMGLMTRTQSEHPKDQGRYDRPNMQVGGPHSDDFGRIKDIPTSSVYGGEDGQVFEIHQNPAPLYGSPRERHKPEVRVTDTLAPSAVRNVSGR